VMVSGLVEGDIQASSQIVLHKTAVVNGDLIAPTIVMEEGSQLNGNVRMGRAHAAANNPSAAKSNPAQGSASGDKSAHAGNPSQPHKPS
jgi:cytoskeletal protein CcmA (bactofilin family)